MTQLFGRLSSNSSDLLLGLDAGDEVAEQVLDAGLEGRGRGRAARAGALHVQVDRAVAEALEGDIAAIHGHGRTDAGRDQLLDDFDGLGVAVVAELIDLL